MADLFAEIFPLEAAALPTVTAYQLMMATDAPAAARGRAGGRLARHLRRVFPGVWLWLDDHLLTDTARGEVEVMIALDMLKAEQPENFGGLDGLTPAPEWTASPRTLAEIGIRHLLKPLETSLQTALAQQQTPIRNATIEREYKLRAWDVGGDPAVSVSIASRLIYHQNIQQYAGTERDIAILNEKLAGLRAWDALTGLRGTIQKILGPMIDHRARLLGIVQDEAARHLISAAMDGEWVVLLTDGKDTYEYLASMLRVIVPLAHINRFELEGKLTRIALQMTPATRAIHVKAVSDVAKEAAVLANAYNSRTRPERFFSADFEMNLRFAANRVRAYKPEALAHDFAQCGAYRLREAFHHAPVRVCVVNTLTFKVEDFVEAMQRHLKRHFDFMIEVIRERQVRVVSRPNLESAVRVVEKEDPDIILAFFADEINEDEGDDETDPEATASYMKSLTLGRGIPTHIINQSTLDDPEAMPSIIMNILGKTGNAPFVLAEPLEGVDYVVGLDIMRQVMKATGETRLTAVARVYRADGEFSHYRVRQMTLHDDAPPYVLLRDLFPQRLFSHKRVVVHHVGEFPAELLTALTGWARAINATFYPVEIVRFGAPRLYALEGGVKQPPWGSAFKLNEAEALLVAALPSEDITPQPLHVRCIGGGGLPLLPLEEVLRGVLVWSLLAYNIEKLPKMPVTVINTDEVAYWLRKGGTFGAEEGDVPFWL